MPRGEISTKANLINPNKPSQRRGAETDAKTRST
uniref:Uncharacterized protein n=1 Tax=Zea mays TaxID=4577 RepID=C0PED5_MAIZE|nr:unknown [Zea mays]